MMKLNSESLKYSEKRELAALQATRQKRQNLRRWASDPCAYAEERLGLVLWDRLREVLNSVRDNRLTTVQSANGIGKTTAIAILVFWWLDTRPESKVLTSSSNFSVLANAVWPQIHTLNAKANVFPKDSLLDMAIKLGPNRFAYAKSSNEPEGIQGAHSPNTLVVVDEASGIDPKIQEGFDGNVIGENDRMLLSGNPLVPAGVFFDKCYDKSGHHIQISALEHPNVIHGRNVIPGAVSRESVLENCIKWGTEVEAGYSGATHLAWCDRWFLLDYRGVPRILGQFPDVSEMNLISRAKIEECKKREPISGRYWLGIDPAESPRGDETGFALVNQFGVVGTEGHVGFEPDQTAGRAAQIAKDFPLEGIAIDCSGGYGGGVVAFLRNNPDLANVRILPVNFAESSSDKTRWANIKGEIYWLLAQQIERNPNYFIAPDPVFEKQAAEVRSKPGPFGQDIIESKKEYKARMNGESPDRFEAVALANYGATQTHGLAAVGSRYTETKTND